MSLPAGNQVAGLSVADKREALKLLFEPCETLVQLAVPILNASDSSSSWPQLIEQIRSELLKLEPEDKRVTQIVAAHPRLGAKKVDSAQSQAEQASLKASETEAAELKHQNEVYESTFPGLRYVVFVAGRPRSEILIDMKQRIHENNYKAEVGRAFNAMCDIALDRQAKLLLAAASADRADNNDSSGSGSSKI